MSQTTIQSFATQIGIPPEKLVQQLVAAGIPGKQVGDALSDEEKFTLLTYLRSHHGGDEGGAGKITLKHKSVSQVTARGAGGPSRTARSTRNYDLMPLDATISA